MSRIAPAAVTDEFIEVLTKLFNRIENIFRCQTMVATTWFELYTFVYKSCTVHPSVEWTLYAAATGRQKYLLSAGIYQNTSRICGGQLYYNLEKYLLNYIRNLYEISNNMTDEDFFRFYIDQWNKYQSAMKLINCIFSYLHKYWIVHARIHGFTLIYETFMLSMLIWLEFFLMPIADRLTNICFKMIDNERKTHVIINTDLIKNLVDSYMMFNFDQDMPIWFYEQPTTIPAINVYKRYFEIPFIENTKRFYQIEADKHVNESLLEYLTKVARYLDDEEHRVHLSLRLSSIESFLTMIEETLIRNYLDDICHQVKNMLNEQNYHDLECLFKLIKRMSIPKTKLKPIIQDYIYQKGYQSIEQTNTTTIQDPQIFIKTIVDIYEKYSQLIKDIFSNDPIFVDAFNQACGKFININAVTGTSKTLSHILAQYCDKLLRKKNRVLQEDEFDKHLNSIMIVFNYIEDKDAFESFYRKFLSKRLLHQLTVSDEYERTIISKLKQTGGSAYTFKLEGLLKDIQLSKDTMDQYQAYCETKQFTHTFSFSSMILSSNLWILSISDKINLPEKVNMPIKSTEQKEIENVYRTIDEDRKIVIQATIIRIMKSRQTLTHTLLMQEVIQQLSSRFKPQIPLIKKCIDILIEKDYIERDSNDKDILRYLA